MIHYNIIAQVTKAEYYRQTDLKILEFSNKYPNAPFDSIVAFVNNTCPSQENKVRSYYTWIASNISYDLDHKNTIELVQMFKTNTSLNSNQTADEVFKNRKAVCEGYSKLMNKFCKSSKIPCYLVCGYTKILSGEIPEMLHAWNAVKIDSAWMLLDITWASGYVNQNNTFVKHFSNQYFLSKPKIFVKDHLPLDPMWQLLKYPFTKKEFESDSMLIAHSKPYNFPDSINAYRAQSEKQQIYLDFLHHYRNEPDNKNFARNLDVYNNNLISNKLNIGVLYQNDFIDLVQKKLSKKPTLSDCKIAKSLLDSAQVYYLGAQTLLSEKRPFTEEFKKIFNIIQITIMSNFENLKLNSEYLIKTKSY